jgi:hypothetical protein
VQLTVVTPDRKYTVSLNPKRLKRSDACPSGGAYYNCTATFA